jgi:hypothetical protein
MMMLGMTMQKPIESIWEKLEKRGVAPAHIRVSADHPLDLYAELSDEAQVGLLAICDLEPPVPPIYESVTVDVGRRSDSRWSVQLKLLRPELRSQFARLCDDIILSGETGVRKERAGHYVLERLSRWRRLLDLGPDGLLSDIAMRGLTAELLFLKDAISLYSPLVAVNAWQGPFDAAQDFHLPDRRYEIKAVLPYAVTVKISSIDQLDTAESEINLVVYALRRVDLDSAGAFTLPVLINGIREALAPTGDVLDEFNVRLANTGYRDLDEYKNISFRMSDVKFFSVDQDFPRLARSELTSGIAAATYDVRLSECESFRVAPVGRS